MRGLKFFATLSFLSSFSFAASGAIIIDTFEDGADGMVVSQFDTAGTSAQVLMGDGSLSGVINGYRTAEATLAGDSLGAAAMVQMSNDGFNAANLAINLSGGQVNTRASGLLYWGLGNSVVGDISLNLDLSTALANQESFELVFDSPSYMDSGKLVDFWIELETAGGGQHSIVKSIALIPGTTQTVYFALSDFEASGFQGAAANFSDIDKVLLSASSEPGTYIGMNYQNFQVVSTPIPEPASAVLCIALCSLCLLAFKRRS